MLDTTIRFGLSLSWNLGSVYVWVDLIAWVVFSCWRKVLLYTSPWVESLVCLRRSYSKSMDCFCDAQIFTFCMHLSYITPFSKRSVLTILQKLLFLWRSHEKSMDCFCDVEMFTFCMRLLHYTLKQKVDTCYMLIQKPIK